MNHERVLGIQVAGGEIRIVELRRSGGGWRIVTRTLPEPPDGAARAPAPAAPAAPTPHPRAAPPAAVPGENGGPAEVGAAPLRIAAVPGAAVLTRRWPVPPADADATRRILANRIDAELPVAVGDLNWGFRRIQNGRAPEEGGDVVVQAARVSAVQQLETRLAAVQLRPDVVTTEAEAIAALYRYGLDVPPAAHGTDVLLAATATTWRVAVVRDGVVQVLRRIEVRGSEPDGALRECQQLLRAELEHGAAYRILWCASDDASVTEDLLRDRLRGKVLPIRLRTQLYDTANLPLAPPVIADYAVALGLALAGTAAPDDFLCLVTHVRDEGKAVQSLVERVARRGRAWAIAAGVALVLAGLLHVGAIAIENAQMRAFLAEAGKTNALADLQPKIERMQRLRTYRIDVEDLIADVCRTVPNDVIITSLTLARERRLVVQGVSRNPGAAFTMADALRPSGRFADVNPERAEPGQGGGFTISAELARVTPLTGPRGGGAAW